MLIRVGCEIAFDFPEPTALVLMLYLHPVRAPTVRQPERFQVDPQVPAAEFFDTYGNRCGRAVRSRGTRGVSQRGRSSMIAGCPTCRSVMRRRSTCRTCRKRYCCSCWPAAIAKWTAN